MPTTLGFLTLLLWFSCRVIKSNGTGFRDTILFLVDSLDTSDMKILSKTCLSQFLVSMRSNLIFFSNVKNSTFHASLKKLCRLAFRRLLKIWFGSDSKSKLVKIFFFFCNIFSFQLLVAGGTVCFWILTDTQRRTVLNGQNKVLLLYSDFWNEAACMTAWGLRWSSSSFSHQNLASLDIYPLRHTADDSWIPKS